MLEGFADSERTWKEKDSRLVVRDLRTANNKVRPLKGQFAALKRDSVAKELFYRRIQEMKGETF